MLMPAKTGQLFKQGQKTAARWGLVAVSGILITACSSQPGPKDQLSEDSKSLESEKLDDLESDELLSDKPGKKKETKKTQVSTECKKTGKTVDGLVINQQNEFLGMTTLKVSKLGVRLESPTITCIMKPGQEAMAYNCRNGSSMQLTQKSASLLAGSRNMGMPTEQKTKKLGNENIAGLDCTHYELTRYFQDPKSKQTRGGWSSELWACKNVGLPPEIIKDVARLTQMPPELGFPVRIEREAATTQSERQKGESRAYVKRRVINTSAQRKEKLDTGEFDYLDGFKKVKDEMQLMMSSDDDDLLEDALGEESK